MKVFRLSRAEFADDLSGFGASIAGGRWNFPGEYLLYTAQTSSLSILESLVHLNGATMGMRYELVTINIADNTISTLEDLKIDLPKNWAELDQIPMTRRIGSDWLKSLESPVLKVPSVLNPLEHNYLLNPRHSDLKIAIADRSWFFFDGRLRSNN